MRADSKFRHAPYRVEVWFPPLANKGEVIQFAQFVGLPDSLQLFIFNELEDHYGARQLWYSLPSGRWITKAVELYSHRVRYVDSYGNEMDMGKAEALALAQCFVLRRVWAKGDSERNDYLTFMAVYARSRFRDQAAAQTARRIYWKLRRRGDFAGIHVPPSNDPAVSFPEKAVPRELDDAVMSILLKRIYLPVFKHHPPLS